MNKSTTQTLRCVRPMTWETFKNVVPRIQKKLNKPFFRGQGNKYLSIGRYSQCGWKLEPSLFRIPGNSHPGFIAWLKKISNRTDVKNDMEKIIGFSLNIDDSAHRENIMALLRHMGFPAPLLDWTENPFKAAYFAFNGIYPDAKEVAIFLFDQYAWQNNISSLTSRDRRKVELKVIRPVISRQIAQESVYTYFRGGIDIYSQILGDGAESEGEESFITYWYLSVDEKDVILNDLKAMDVTQKSLFPDESNEGMLALKDRIRQICYGCGGGRD